MASFSTGQTLQCQLIINNYHYLQNWPRNCNILSCSVPATQTGSEVVAVVVGSPALQSRPVVSE